MPHIHEKIDFTAEVFVVYQDKVLLRKHDKYKMWLSVGGHIELDEDPEHAAIREVKEEVGLDIELVGARPEFAEKDYRELLVPRFMNRHKVSPTHEHVTLIYFGRAQTDQLVLSTNELSEECKWFSKEELNNPAWGIYESVKTHALTALNELK